MNKSEGVSSKNIHKLSNDLMGPAEKIKYLQAQAQKQLETDRKKK